MPYVKAMITWPGDERRIAIEGRMSQRAFEYVRDQLKEERELVNLPGIRPVAVQIGAKRENPDKERQDAQVTEDVGSVFDAVADIGDDDDDDDFDVADFESSLPESIGADNEVLDFVMPFGKHRGKTLWEIACEAPKYLDWAAGEFDGDRDVDKMIQAVVKIPAVSKKIDNAVF